MRCHRRVNGLDNSQARPEFPPRKEIGRFGEILFAWLEWGRKEPDSAGTGPNEAIDNPSVEPAKHTRDPASQPSRGIHRPVNHAFIGASGARCGLQDQAVQNMFLIEGVDIPSISQKLDYRIESPIKRPAAARNHHVIAPGEPDAARRDHA